MTKRRSSRLTPKLQQMRRALFDAQRARGEAILRISDANRRIIDALLSNDPKAALKAREDEYEATCDREHLSGLIARLQRALETAGVAPPTPDTSWIAKRYPAILQAAADALGGSQRSRT